MEKTGRLLVVDNGWICCGAAAEIVTQVTERLQGHRPFRMRRMGFAPVTCPTAPNLEQLYYPDGRTIAAAARDLVEETKTGWMPRERPELHSFVFKGPF